MLMKTDELGIPRFSNKDLLDMIYTGHIDKCHVVLCDPNDDIDKFNKHAKEQGISELKKYVPLDVDKGKFDNTLQSEWFMPNKYKAIDIKVWLLEKLQKELQSDSLATAQYSKEWHRITEEYTEYANRNMEDLLRYMIYLVDFMRENNIVWGVGRGSSVASYVLYLIGVHKVDSIQFDLDWREFLR